MADTGLYPTPNRLALLADVKAGHVYRVTQKSATYDRNSAAGRRCTADMREMERAGWVGLRLYVDDDRTTLWLITAVGEAVLLRPAHPGSAACHSCYDAHPDQYLQFPTVCPHRVEAAGI